jgi:alkyl sulfatase BDS1-like metallo-beta-lactamase superfamily hydrolase
VFQVTPDTEAPAEMNFFFPKLGALCMAENCTCHLHNLYTPRGAQVRDAKAWSFYIDEAIDLFAGDTQALFASHHWPRWGSDDARAFLTIQRDLYKYVHDQTLRMANHGLTPKEIAEELALPPTLAAQWHTRGYYGTLNHNAKAVYQRYLGWFDGNPAEPAPAAADRGRPALRRPGRRPRGAAGQGHDRVRRRRLPLGGRGGEPPGVRRSNQHRGPRAAGRRAGAAGLSGRVRTLARLLPHRRAGAAQPGPASPTPRQAALAQLPRLPGSFLLDSLSVRLNGPKVGAQTLQLGVRFSDTDERFLVEVENAVMRHYPDRTAPGAATVTLSRATLVQLVSGAVSLDDAIAGGAAVVEGDRAAVAQLLGWLDRFDFWFKIIEP